MNKDTLHNFGGVATLAMALWVGFLFVPFVHAQTTEVDWDRIRTGEVIVKAVSSPDGLPGVRAMFSVQSSREGIWKALVDYDHFAEIFSGVEKIEVITADTNGAMVEMSIDAVLTTLRFVLYRKYDNPGHKLTWDRVSGDLKRVEGSWTILDTPDSTQKLLIYDSYVKVGGIVPTRLVRWSAMRKAEEMGLRFRNWVVEHSVEQ